MSNDSKTLKKRRGVDASCSVLFNYLHPSNFIAEIYPNKDNNDSLSGIIIIKRKVRIVIRRGQICIFIKLEDFEDKLNSAQNLG